MYPDYTIKSTALIANQDIDLRKTFDEILFGTDKERARGRWVVVQKLLRNAEDEPIVSPYTYKLTEEGKDKNRGPNTTRTGFLCNEILTKCVYAPAGRMTMDESAAEAGQQIQEKDVVYLPSATHVKQHDVVIFIEIGDDGKFTNPIKATKEVIITKIYEKCSDEGRIEFYICIVEEQK